MTTSLVQVPFSSEECEIAFYHSLQPSLMSRLDEIRLGSVMDYFELLGDETIYLLFKECCVENGYEVACDDQSQYFLLRTPKATLAANKIYEILRRHCASNGLNEDDVYAVSEHNKSRFKTIAQSYLLSHRAEWNNSDDPEGKSVQFKDGSNLAIMSDGIKIWNCDPVNDGPSFTEFVLLFGKKLDMNLCVTSGDCDSLNQLGS